MYSSVYHSNHIKTKSTTNEHFAFHHGVMHFGELHFTHSNLFFALQRKWETESSPKLFTSDKKNSTPQTFTTILPMFDPINETMSPDQRNETKQNEPKRVKQTNNQSCRTVKETVECLWQALKSFHYCLLIFDLTLSQPLRHLRHHLVHAVVVVTCQNALNGCSFVQNIMKDSRKELLQQRNVAMSHLSCHWRDVIVATICCSTLVRNLGCRVQYCTEKFVHRWWCVHVTVQKQREHQRTHNSNSANMRAPLGRTKGTKKIPWQQRTWQHKHRATVDTFMSVQIASVVQPPTLSK